MNVIIKKSKQINLREFKDCFYMAQSSFLDVFENLKVCDYLKNELSQLCYEMALCLKIDNSSKELTSEDVKKCYCEKINVLYFKYINVKACKDKLKQCIVKMGSNLISLLFGEGVVLKNAVDFYMEYSRKRLNEKLRKERKK